MSIPHNQGGFFQNKKPVTEFWNIVVKHEILRIMPDD